MCFAVVALAVMLVVGGESATATVKEAGNVAAKEVDNGWGRSGLSSVC